MHYAGSALYRRLVWFVIFSFLFSSTPNVELVASEGWKFLCRLALSEAHAAEVEEDADQASAKSKADTGENASGKEGKTTPEAEAAPAKASASSSSGDKGGSAVTGSLTPAVEISQFSGAAAITVPIEVPPGRMDMAPRLSLTYNSYLGNGWMGMGWNLDMGSIQRSTKRGVNYSAYDFVASIGGSMAELTPRSDWGSGYYGATVEGALSKYYYNTSTGGWEVTSRDGTKYYYGTTSASRQDFDGGTSFFRWCLDRVVDVHGNYMTVTYVKDQGEIYPATINYTGNEKTGLAPLNQLRFHLETRQDASYGFTPNRPVVTAMRLKTIEVSGAAGLVRAFRLAYVTSAGTTRSLLSTIEQFGSDAVIDAQGTITGGTQLPPMRLGWEEQRTHYFNPTGGFRPADVYSGNSPYWTYGDFNGDKRTDIIYYTTSGTWRIWFSNGDGTFTASGGFRPGDAASFDSTTWTYGDFNGDGKTDIIYYTTSGTWRIWFSNGDGTFTATAGFRPGDAASFDPTMWAYRDFNGDGKTDIIYYTTSGTWKIWFSNGDGTFTASGGFRPGDAASFDPTMWTYRDFNGDGKTDLIYYTTSNNWRIWFSNGDGTFLAGQIFCPPDVYGFNSNYWTYGDFNGDARTDIIYYTTSGTWRRWYSGGGKDLVESLASPLGSTTTISYTPSSAYRNGVLPFVLQTVSSVTTSDGRGNSYTVRHAYEGGLYDYTDREFRGFRKSTSHQMADSEHYESQTETWYHQDHTRKGLIEAQLVTAAEGHTRQVNNVYTAAALATGVTWPRLDSVVTSVTDRGYAPYATTVDYVYDPAYLTVLEEHKYGMEEADDVHTYMTYTNLTGPSIIGKPADVTVKGPSGGIVTRKWMDYNATTGSLITEEVCASGTPATGCTGRNSAQNPIVSYTYSTEGNVTSVIDPRGLRTTFAYDATRTFATETVNPLNHTTSKTYDPATGKVLSLTPIHLQGTARAVTYTYDVFGRPASDTRPDGGSTTYGYHNVGSPSSQYVERIEHIVSGSEVIDHCSYTLFDGLGRAYSVWSSGPDGETIVTDTAYDSVGRPYRKSRPYLKGIDTPVYTTVEYDGFSREIATTFPDGGQVLTAYQGLIRQVADPGGNLTASTYDVNKRLRQVTDPAGTVTGYTYDTLGNLTKVVAAKGQPEQNVTAMTYDSLSKKTSMTDPDMGHWTYTYDKSGNLASQTDPYGQRITFDYDGANRLTRKAYTSYLDREAQSGLKAYAVTYTYDDPLIPFAKGMLTKTTGASSGTKEDNVLALDIMQRVTKSKKVIDGESVTIAKTYDSAGRTVTQTYFPDTMQAHTLAYTYDAAGNTVAVYDSVSGQDHVQYMVHNASGQPGYALYPKSDGSFLRTAYTYDARTGRLAALTTEKVGQGTQTAACGMRTDKPVVPWTYTCDRTQQAFSRQEDCANACLQTGTCAASAPATFSGSASPRNGRGDMYAVGGSNNTLNFTCAYETQTGDMADYSCGSVTSSTGTFSGSASVRNGYGTIYGVSASGTTMSFTCGYATEWGYETYSCGSITYTSTPVYTCPFGSGYPCDANHACRRAGTCAAKAGEPQCPDGYTLTGDTCVSYTCPLGSRYACSGTPVTCTGVASGTGIPIQDLSYEYDLMGNVTKLTDTVNNITHTYTYDTLNRLLTARGEGEKGYTQSYSYDRIGNITYKSDVGTYVYNYANKPHAVRQAGGISLDYDRVGNMTRKARTDGPTLTISWNPDNKPELIKKDGSSYIRFSYDSSGTRVKKENLQTGSTTTYFGDAYEKRDSVGVIHVHANGRRIASIRTDGRTLYYHTNHLGSSSVITDDTGNTKETIDYHPFGTYRVRQDLDPSFPNTNYTFTGQEDDDETGLYNYNARLYDPELGRFISADSIIPEPGNLEAFNRYSYCVPRNNVNVPSLKDHGWPGAVD